MPTTRKRSLVPRFTPTTAVIVVVIAASPAGAIAAPLRVGDGAQAKDSPSQRDRPRPAEEAMLIDMIEGADRLGMSAERAQKFRALMSSDLAGLRLELGDVVGAQEAIASAVAYASEQGSDGVRVLVNRQRAQILRAAALRAAHAGDVEVGLELLEMAMALPGILLPAREKIAGDRFLLLARRDDRAQRGTTGGDLRHALAKVMATGRVSKRSDPRPRNKAPAPVAAAPTPKPRPVATLGRDVGQAALPSTIALPRKTPGTINRSAILRVVSTNKSSVTDCYTHSLNRGGLRTERSRRSRGRLEILVTIQPSGSVSNATVQSELFEGTPLAHCVTERVAQWRFPPFSGSPVQIAVPFVLDHY